MDKLHLDVTLDIFSRLPAESVTECKRVCKAWFNGLNDASNFAEMHLRRRLLLHQHVEDGNYEYSNHSPSATSTDGIELCMVTQKGGELWYGKYDENDKQSFRTVKMINRPPNDDLNDCDVMIGSCNGLVCLRVPHSDIRDPVYVFNPVTGECVSLPRFINGKYSGFEGVMLSGFGYHPSTNEYKVVRIYYPNYEEPLGQVQVYTLGSGSGWRDKGGFPYSFARTLGVLANRELYWLVDEGKNIVAFNLANEEFRFIASPPVGMANHYRELCVLGGCLSLVVGYGPVEIWLLKKKNCSFNMNEQEDKSWSKEFTIMTHGVIEPLVLTKRGEVLLLQDYKFFCLYDPKTARLERLEKHVHNWSKSFQAIPHLNSFVSLKALGECADDPKTARLERLEKHVHKGSKSFQAIPHINTFLSLKPLWECGDEV